MSRARRIIQLGTQATQGLVAGSQPELGRTAAEEAVDAIRADVLSDQDAADIHAYLRSFPGRNPLKENLARRFKATTKPDVAPASSASIMSRTHN
jgi:mono/diheme cytochrome c family protein